MTKEEAMEALRKTAGSLAESSDTKAAALVRFYAKADEVISGIDGIGAKADEVTSGIDGIDRDALISDMGRQLVFRMNPGIRDRVKNWIEEFGK